MSAKPVKASFAALSDIGRVRTHNEDSVLATPPLFAVADGLGGHEAGEIASAIAIEALREAAPDHVDAKALARAVRAGNREVMRAAKEGRGRAGMGTTITAAMVEGTHIALAHVGDSRGYLFHAGTLQRVTADHSMVADMVRRGEITEEESRSHPHRSIITRALGTDPNMYADTYELDAEPGDRLLLASDGLTGMVPDDEIGRILARNPDPDEAVAVLITAANAAGGHDNISAVLVDIQGQVARPDSAARNRSWAALAMWIVVTALVVGGIIAGVYRYTSSRAYLIDEGGVVAIYTGMPGRFAGLSLSERSDLTTIPVSALPPAQRQRLQEGIALGSLAEAQALAEQYRADAESGFSP